MLSPDISLQDLEIFVEIGRLRSLKEAARQMDRRASSLSKVISTLEKKVGSRLFHRSLRGMELTPEGTELYRTAQKMVALAADIHLELAPKQKRPKRRKVYGIGSISFLCSRMIAPSLDHLREIQKDARFRIAEFSHNQIMHYATRGAFDIALHIGPIEFSKAWHSVPLAEMRWGLFGRYGHPLGTLNSSEHVLQYPFVVPTGWNELEGFVEGVDNCPASPGERIPGNEATTAETASEVIQLSDELSFIPVITALQMVRARRLQEIRVQDWPDVRKQIYLSVRSDRISKKMFEQLRSSFKKVLRASEAVV